MRYSRLDQAQSRTTVSGCLYKSMIYYIVTAKHSYTIGTYLASWGRSLVGLIRPISYEELLKREQLSGGTYIFSDLERLSPAQTEIAVQIWEQLSQAGPRVRLFNHPGRTLRRYDLLRALYKSGKNRFRATRARESFASEHTASLTPLLHNPAELNQALLGLLVRGHRLRDLLVVEFCDTSDASGLFRKYSAFRMGAEVLPGHIYISRNWVAKRVDAILDETWEREEREYLERNPHVAWLKEIFGFARVDYGRIDYSIFRGEPQVWEINTNPMLFHFPEEYPPSHLPAQERLAPQFPPLFEAIDCQDSIPEIPISIHPTLLRAVIAEDRGTSRARLSSAFIRKLVGTPRVKSVVSALKPRIQRHAAFVVKMARLVNRAINE